MLREIRPAIVLLLGLTLIGGLLYPLGMTGIAELLLPQQANGSLVERNGKVVGSAIIGQNFTGPGYFHGRPSATTDTDPNDSTKTIASPYNAANSAASNAGPTSKALVDRVTADLAKLRHDNPDAVAAGLPVPMDLVTTSASGLDPDISPEAAAFQIARIAKARQLTPQQVQAVVDANVKGRLFGLLGERRVNVLALNMALDAAK